MERRRTDGKGNCRDDGLQPADGIQIHSKDTEWIKEHRTNNTWTARTAGSGEYVRNGQDITRAGISGGGQNMKKMMIILAAVVVLVIVTVIIGQISINDTERTIAQTDAFIELAEVGR